MRECEELLKCVCKEAGTCGWISRVARGYKPPNWSTRAKHAKSWSVAPAVHYRTKVLGWLGRLHEFELTTQPSREVKPPKHPVWQNMTFHIPYHLTIYIPLYPWFREIFQREFWARNLKENKIDSSTIFTWETLQIPLLYSSPLSNPWEAHFQNIFSSYPFLWDGYLVLWETIRKEPISHWLMLWSSSRIWEVRKEIGSAQPRDRKSVV